VLSSVPAAPALLLSLEVVAVLAALIGLPSPIFWPAISGIDGSSMSTRVFTVGLSLLYKVDFGLSKANESGFTWSLGIYAIASVVM